MGKEDKKSGFIKAPAPGSNGGQINNVGEAKDLSELQNYMWDKYRLGISDAVGSCDFTAVRNNMQGVEDILREFPQARAFLGDHFTVGVEFKNDAYAHCEFGGRLAMYETYFRNADVLNASYQNTVFSKFHPAGTTADDIMTHEMGHALERAIIGKYVLGGGTPQNVMDHLAGLKAWSNGTYATKIIGNACRVVKKTSEGKGLSNDQLVARVSRYATDKRSEALAECVADYARNRSKANPLSIAVWNELKKELG